MNGEDFKELKKRVDDFSKKKSSVLESFRKSLDAEAVNKLARVKDAEDEALKKIKEKTAPIGTIRAVAGFIDGKRARELLEIGWMYCEGRALKRDDYPELFSVIGIRYGKKSEAEFFIPDLRGRTMTGAGHYLDGKIPKAREWGSKYETKVNPAKGHGTSLVVGFIIKVK